MNKDKFIGYMMYASGIISSLTASQTNDWFVALYAIAGVLLGSIFLSLKENKEN